LWADGVEPAWARAPCADNVPCDCAMSCPAPVLCPMYHACPISWPRYTPNQPALPILARPAGRRHPSTAPAIVSGFSLLDCSCRYARAQLRVHMRGAPAHPGPLTNAVHAHTACMHVSVAHMSSQLCATWAMARCLHLCACACMAIMMSMMSCSASPAATHVRRTTLNPRPRAIPTAVGCNPTASYLAGTLAADMPVGQKVTGTPGSSQLSCIQDGVSTLAGLSLQSGFTCPTRNPDIATPPVNFCKCGVCVEVVVLSESFCLALALGSAGYAFWNACVWGGRLVGPVGPPCDNITGRVAHT